MIREPHWRFASGAKCLIRGDEAPNWFDLERDARATLIKSNPRRRIRRVRYNDNDLIVKEFDEPAAESLVRRIVRTMPARCEWRAARAAAKRDVACPRMVAFGRAGAKSVLVMHYLPGAVSLDAAWLRAGDAACGEQQRRNEIIAAVARLLSHAHQSGFLHGDDHPRNILMGTGPEGRMQAHYIDLQRARCTPSLSEKAVIGSLAQLHQWFLIRASAAQRARFFTLYTLDRCNGDPAAARHMRRRLLPALLDRSYRRAAKLWAKRDRRIGQNNAYYARLTSDGGRTAMVTRRFRQRDVYPPPSWPDLSTDAWMKLVFAHPPIVPDNAIELKVFEERGDASHDQYLFTLFSNGQRLRNRDLPCRWPVAWIRRIEGRQTVTYLWRDRHPETVPIFEYVQQLRPNRGARRALAVELARLVRLIANRGVSVTSVGPQTLSVDSATGRVIIDQPDNIAIGRPDVERDRLACARALRAGLFRQFALSRTDAATFLRKLDRRNWRSLWRRAAEGAPGSRRAERSHPS
jgi:tRNA A-37 threonylcarbamoyl transferase component Bud32